MRLLFRPDAASFRKALEAAGWPYLGRWPLEYLEDGRSVRVALTDRWGQEHLLAWCHSAPKDPRVAVWHVCRTTRVRLNLVAAARIGLALTHLLGHERVVLTVSSRRRARAIARLLSPLGAWQPASRRIEIPVPPLQ